MNFQKTRTRRPRAAATENGRALHKKPLRPLHSLVCAAALIALPSLAWADRPKADACAVTLTYASKKIYDASVWNYLDAADRGEFVHAKVEQLVNSWGGLLYEPRYATIEAAVRCLRLLAPDRGLVARY